MKPKPAKESIVDQQPVSTPSPLLPNPLTTPAAFMGPRPPCAGMPTPSCTARCRTAVC